MLCGLWNLRELPLIANALRVSLKIKAMLKRLYIDKSSINGLGLFTDEHISPLERIFLIRGKSIHHYYSLEFSTEGPNWIGIGQEEWLMPDRDNPVQYLNHSCRPNCIISENYYVIALRHVDAFEELTMDYSTTEIDPFWHLDCTCRAVLCRQRIDAFQFLPSHLQALYLPYMPISLTKQISMMATVS